MCKYIAIPGGKRVAEGGTLSTVDHIGGNYRKLQSNRHLEEQFELIDLGTVLGCRDIEFDEAIYGILTGLFADAQVGRLAAGRAGTTGLETKFV